uniref:Trichoplein keratin filament-binding protein n=1 Tax=Cacopsylla melanoneura TaxID=428564 RepID=A0A8D8ZTT4_9HEMI
MACYREAPMVHLTRREAPAIRSIRWELPQGSCPHHPGAPTVEWPRPRLLPQLPLRIGLRETPGSSLTRMMSRYWKILTGEPDQDPAHERDEEPREIATAKTETAKQRDEAVDPGVEREEEEREKAGEELERLRQRQLEAEKARERRAKKREEMNQLKQDLEHQMDLLRKEQEKCDRLKLEEARQCQLEREVDEILVQRELELKRKRNREHGLFLTKQFHLKLKQATRLIQEDLKRDQVLLAEFTARILAETSLDETTRREARQEMDKANNILAQLMEREKARAREMDFVFHEDARRMWEKQECRWSAEQEARTRLLNEVLTGVRAQITANLAANLERQQELLSERERLLQGVEEAKTQWEAKQREIEEKEREWASEVEAQIIEKDLRKKEEELREAEERERERQKALEEERKLAAEMDKMRTSTFVPEYRPRKRIVW